LCAGGGTGASRPPTAPKGGDSEAEMADEAELTNVRVAHRFDVAALEAYLAGRFPGFAPPLNVRQFEGGQSNPTFLLEAAGRRWVLRKKPPGTLLPSAHQVGREYRVMKALEPTGFPAPRMLAHCEDPGVIGAEFFVMEWVSGRVFPDPLLPSLSPVERGALYQDFIDTLARLHAIDPASIGLDEGFGRAGNYYERQISRWSKQYAASRTDDIPEMEQLIAWLPKNIPDDDATSIVHGDYSLRNCIVHPSEPRVAAVLDWELSTIGHPLADVAYACLFYFGETDEAAITASGIPARADLVARYFAASGRSPIADWTFHLAFVLFRVAAINQGVYKRGLDGNAASDRYLMALPGIRRSARRAWRLVTERG
jgi:aminoglycoside phosphotransferase (APT) family kinase protein